MSNLVKDSGAAPAADPGSATAKKRSPLSGAWGRNLGLVVALILLCLVGLITAGDRFASIDNVMTILRLAAAAGVLAIGMTFVITTGGIDLSIGSVLGLSTIIGTTVMVQDLAADMGWWIVVIICMLTGTVAGLVNGFLIAYGKVVAFMATLAMMVAARGLAEIISGNRNLIIKDRDFVKFFQSDILGINVQVWMFIIVAVVAWFLFNRTTFGRRTVAVGGNPEAARLAGIKVKRHLVAVYTLAGLTAGIAAVMMVGRTTTGSSTHGMLYELDAIAAVVVGGTLLIGGRGTIAGTVIGVLIFTTLVNVFTMNNLSISVQSVAKGVIIVLAVMLQQRLVVAGRSKT